MDLFADKYYELHSTKKINYYSLLYSAPTALDGAYSVVGGSIDIIENSTTAILLRDNNDTTYITKANKACHEIYITPTVRKVILE